MVLKIAKHYKDFKGFVRKTKQCSKATMYIPCINQELKNIKGAIAQTIETQNHHVAFRTSTYFSGQS